MKDGFKQKFLLKDPSLEPFLGRLPGFNDYGGLMKERRNFPVDRMVLCTELLSQNKDLDGNEVVLRNVEKLKNENCFTVTAGHQLALAGGPLFTFYKIITAIKLAAHIEKLHPAFSVVPVFWMASEDHDFEEINHFSPSWNETITYEGKFMGPVGRHIFDASIESVFQNFNRQWLNVYKAGKKNADVFREFIHQFFGKYGLVIIDGDSAALKRKFSPIAESELFHQAGFQKVNETIAKMEAIDLEPQAKPREINLFYLGEDGTRQRILRLRSVQVVEDGSSFVLHESKQAFSESEIRNELQLHPERFSPNVILRPLYQCSILPDIAFTGGWAELSYWSELRSLFEHFNVFYPLLVPRFSATIFSPNTAHEWKESGFELKEITEPIHILENKIASTLWSQDELENRISKISSAFDELKEWMDKTDKTLGQSIETQKAKALKPLEEIPAKVRKMLKNKFPANFQKLSEIISQVQPTGKMQERELNIAAIESENPQKFIEFIYNNCDPENFEHQWLIYP